MKKTTLCDVYELSGFLPPVFGTPEGLRPCKVDGEPAHFHRFVDNDRAILKIDAFCRPSVVENILKNFNENHFTGPEGTIEKLRQTMALIEWPDGRLCTVAVERVQFTDRHNGG